MNALRRFSDLCGRDLGSGDNKKIGYIGLDANVAVALATFYTDETQSNAFRFFKLTHNWLSLRNAGEVISLWR
jgi:hypothetical protein